MSACNVCTEQTLGDLIDELQTEGVVLSVEGGELHFKTMKGVLAPGVRRALKDNKDTLINLLDKRPRLINCPSGYFPTPVHWEVCRYLRKLERDPQCLTCPLRVKI